MPKVKKFKEICVNTLPLMSTVRVSGLLVGGLVVASLSVAPAHAQTDDVTLYIVQGLPDESVDVSVNGKTVANDIETAEVAGPFTVDAGENTWSFAGEDGEVLVENMVDGQPGANSDVVLHLPASSGEDPVLTVFDNDLSAVPADKASLTVAHTAAVPPADIVVNDEVLFANVANGESLTLVVPVDTYSVQIVPTGEKGPAILGPVDLAVKGGSLNRVFAVGNPDDDTMDVVVHVLDVQEEGSKAPKVVNTGGGGQWAALNWALAVAASLWR